MTGGEHSVTTPPGGVTATTRAGNLERPLDVCATVAVNGAGFVWRGTAFDRDLADIIAEAVRSESFALLDIWELCTAYYVPNNEFSRKLLEATRDSVGHGGRTCYIGRLGRSMHGRCEEWGGGAGSEEEKPLRPRAAARAVHLDPGPRVPVRDRRLGGRQGALDRQA